jgi:hypothetical protein
MPDDRVESWGELIRTTAFYHDKLRSLLRQAMKLPLGNGAPLMDAGLVAAAMQEMKANLCGIKLPAKPEFTRGLEDISKLVELARQTDSQLRHIPDREAKSLQQRKEKILTLLRQSSLSHHVRRVDRALNGAATAMFEAAPVERDVYFKARTRLQEMGLLDESSGIWGSLEDYLLADDPALKGDAEQLTYVLGVPVASLRPTRGGDQHRLQGRARLCRSQSD